MTALAFHVQSGTGAELFDLKQHPHRRFNALTGEWVDMFKAGIVDPTKVVRCALQNAASIAGLMLTTNTMVTSLKDDHKAVEGSTS